MGQEVYKNDDGAVLFGNSGNVFRRPYEFGDAYDITDDNPGYESLYVRLVSPINNIADGDFSYMMFRKLAVSKFNDRGVLRFESNNYICALGIGYRPNVGDGMGLDFNKTLETIYGSDTTDRSLGSTLGVDSNFEAVVFSNVKCQAFRGNPNGGVLSKEISTSSITFTNEQYNYLTLCRGQRGAYSFEVPDSSIKLNRFLLFNREVSKEETAFMYNNGLGADPQSKNGLLLDLNCKIAEILDFSSLQDGSDMRVGVRDYSGYNRHGEIMNLPAGTLQEQLDYANANLFTSFI